MQQKKEKKKSYDPTGFTERDKCQEENWVKVVWKVCQANTATEGRRTRRRSEKVQQDQIRTTGTRKETEAVL